MFYKMQFASPQVRLNIPQASQHTAVTCSAQKQALEQQGTAVMSSRESQIWETHVLGNS